MCIQIFVKFPCGCARKYQTINCYEGYTCPLNVIKREDVPVSLIKGCQWRCAYCPKAKHDVAWSAGGDSVKAEGREEATKLKEEGTGAVEAEG
jgi:hypothetical protein